MVNGAVLRILEVVAERKDGEVVELSRFLLPLYQRRRIDAFISVIWNTWSHVRGPSRGFGQWSEVSNERWGQTYLHSFSNIPTSKAGVHTGERGHDRLERTGHSQSLSFVLVHSSYSPEMTTL